MASPQPVPLPNAARPCTALDIVYGPRSDEKVRKASVLVVGAGGVGCELVKNLASVGFSAITLIDLDTIDFSNLNRQFLFRRHHVGKPKAVEAAASVRAMFPNTTITPLMANIKESRFSVSFFKQFTLVCNALDNLEARRHVNRMCLAAHVPLIESGSTGYNGQCVVIGPGFECYDCIDRPEQKSYAVCTIRSTPEKPVHCVVWAKFLFELIFGELDEGNVLRDLDGPAPSAPSTTESTANSETTTATKGDAADKEADETDKPSATENVHIKDKPATDEKSDQMAGKPTDMKNEQSKNKSAVTNVTTTKKAETPSKSADDSQDKSSEKTVKSGNVAMGAQDKQMATEKSTEPNKLNTDGEKAMNGQTVSALDTVPSASVSRKTPKRVRFLDTDTPESFATRVCERVFVDDIEEQCLLRDRWTSRAPPRTYDVNAATNKAGPILLSDVNLLAQEVWTDSFCASIFRATLVEIATKRREEIGRMSFNKDDKDALAFVAAAANLRAKAYGVEMVSPFAVKGIAGNIVHAIATTNAMVGGLIVLEALKITSAEGKLDGCLSTFVTRVPSGSRVRRVLAPDRLRAPKKTCFVCSKGHLILSVDVTEMVLSTLVSSVAQKKLSLLQPTINVTTGEYHNTVYECGAGLEEDEVEEYEANGKKKLKDLRIEDGTQLVMEDLMQKFSCTVHVRHVAGLLPDKEENERFTLDGDVGKPVTENGTEEKEKGAVEDVDDDVAEVEVSKGSEEVSKKRSVAQVDVEKMGEPEAKKARAQPAE